MDATAFPLLCEWARQRQQPVTIFDLETTTNIPYVDWMGITEFACVTFWPNGRLETRVAFVNPERRIPPKVRELTGICQADVADAPTWAERAAWFHELARDHIMVGFNSLSFDCVVVCRQNARYGVTDTAFNHTLDVKALPGVHGSLSSAALALGLTSDVYHRALADTWLTARLAEAVAGQIGLAALTGLLGTKATFGAGNFTNRQTREEELLTFYVDQGELPELTEFGAKHGIKRTTAEGDVVRLIEAGKLEWAVLENVDVQLFLAERMAAAIAASWTTETAGRLKPLFLYFEPDAPNGFDYTQLRLALVKYRRANPDFTVSVD